MNLKEFFQTYPRVALAFSGGVDSAYLLYAAKKYAEEVRAYYVKSVFQPQFELDDAIHMAQNLDTKIKVIRLDILTDDSIAANPQNRCYFCKKKIFTEIASEAAKDGFDILIDGTNASDDVADRPGMTALRELSVLSPLRICGLTKDEIRKLSKEAGLFTWNKPSYACLATRIPVGQRISEKSLHRTEAAEEYLASLGFKDFRVRTFGDSARIQVRESQLNDILKYRKSVLEKLGAEYKGVLLDLEVRDE